MERSTSLASMRSSRGAATSCLLQRRELLSRLLWSRWFLARVVPYHRRSRVPQAGSDYSCRNDVVYPHSRVGTRDNAAVDHLPNNHDLIALMQGRGNVSCQGVKSDDSVSDRFRLGVPLIFLDEAFLCIVDIKV